MPIQRDYDQAAKHITNAGSARPWGLTSDSRPERKDQVYATISGQAVKGVYTPLDYRGPGATNRDLANPGDYPFTRGIHATGYRSKPWTLRIFAGFGSAEETNARYKYLIERGNMGLSVAFDLPTLMGYDSDAPEALGEFGKPAALR